MIERWRATLAWFAAGTLAAALVVGCVTAARSQTAVTSNSEALHGNAVLRSFPGIVGFRTSLEQNCTMLKHLIGRANGNAEAQQYEKSEVQILHTQVLRNGTKVSLVRRVTVVCPGLPEASPFTDPHELVLVKVNDPHSKFNQTQVWVVADTVDASATGINANTQRRLPVSCKIPDHQVAVLKAVVPDYPESARDLGIGAVIVQIDVTVGPLGNLISASVYKSANNMALDQAALRAARQSTYSPKLEDCKPVTGSYLFTAAFEPEQE
jgi:TonB family protein